MTYKVDRAIQDHSWRQDAAATGATKPAPSWEQTKEDCVGPDLPADDPLYDRAAAAQALAMGAGEPSPPRQATPGEDKSPWEQIKGTYWVGPDLPDADPCVPTLAELAAEPPLEDALYDRLTDEIDRRKDVEAQLAKMTDAHAIVSQRLVGAQKEVAERDATIDELRTALESIAANVGLVGSDQWAVGAIVGKVGEATARAAKVEDRLRRDDELRSQLAVAVGLDGSASLALILDTVTRDRPAPGLNPLSGLLDVLAAPVTFGGRHLSTAERAEWALRRALRERDECTPRMAQLIEAEVCLDVLGVPAYAAVPGDDPGDASEALTVAERIRLHFGAQS